MSKKQNKYEYLWVLQGHYGQGWEDLTASERRKDMRDNLKDYRENEGGRYRIIFRREPVETSLGSDFKNEGLAI